MAVPKVGVWGQYIFVWSPYHEEYIAELKARIDFRDRAWLADVKCWRFVVATKQTVLLLLVEFYGEYETVTLDREPGQPSQSRANDYQHNNWRSHTSDGTNTGGRTDGRTQPLAAVYARLHLMPDAPAELVQAAYRCLAKLKHPDMGGNTQAMQDLNAAYETLRKNGAG